jgi:hypothetical protein
MPSGDRREHHFIHAVSGRVFRGTGLIYAKEPSQDFADAMARLGVARSPDLTVAGLLLPRPEGLGYIC